MPQNSSGSILFVFGNYSKRMATDWSTGNRPTYLYDISLKDWEVQLMSNQGHSEFENRDFLIAEYKESVNAYFKGVDIAYNSLRSYFVLNGILLAAFASLSQNKNLLSAELGLVLPIISGVGLITSLLLHVSIGTYQRHLACVRMRCVQIEQMFRGSLLSGIEKISTDRRRIIKSSVALRVIATIFFALWLVALTYSMFGHISSVLR